MVLQFLRGLLNKINFARVNNKSNSIGLNAKQYRKVAWT